MGAPRHRAGPALASFRGGGQMGLLKRTETLFEVLGRSATAPPGRPDAHAARPFAAGTTAPPAPPKPSVPTPFVMPSPSGGTRPMSVQANAVRSAAAMPGGTGETAPAPVAP